MEEKHVSDVTFGMESGPGGSAVTFQCNRCRKTRAFKDRPTAERAAETHLDTCGAKS